MIYVSSAEMMFLSTVVFGSRVPNLSLGGAQRRGDLVAERDPVAITRLPRFARNDSSRESGYAWVVFGCSVGVGMIVHTYIFATYYGRAFLGTIRGIVMPINLLSAGLGAPLVGYLHDYSGSYLLAWWILLGLYGCTALLILTAVPPRKAD